MKHVHETWLRLVNMGYVVFAALVIVLFVLAKYSGSFDWLLPIIGNSMVAPTVALIAIIYSFTGLQVIKRKNIWTAYFIAYFLILLVGFLSLEVTGSYDSYYFIALTAIAFTGGMLGHYGSLLPVGLGLSGALLIITGVYESQSSTLRMVMSLTIMFSGSLLGWLVWRLFYERVTSENSALVGMLKNERLKSEFILNSMNDGVVLVDGSGVIQYINPAAATIVGWERQDAMGINYNVVLKLCTEDHKPYTIDQDPIHKAKGFKGSIRDNNAVLETKSGKFIPIVMDASTLYDAQGVATGNIIGVFRDVSKERVEEARRAEFISTASHEMRTPVAAIEGYLALALNDKVSTVDTRARSYLEKAHTSTQHLGKLFQDLLTSAKAEDGRLSSHPTVVEMGEYLEKLTDDLKFAAEKKSLFLEFVIGGNESTIDASGGSTIGSPKVVRPLYYIHVDADRLREVITNLFDNAVKYTDSGKISIGLTGDDKVVQFYIRDTGPGIPREDQPHLFQKFYRVDNSSTRTVGGTGLGLFICRKIIELYNGRIWVESEVDKGSTFYINLPRLEAQKVSALQATEASNVSGLDQLPATKAANP